MGIRTLIVMGLLTDQCIDHTIKDAADRGYRVVCLEDACQPSPQNAMATPWPASRAMPR